MERRLESFGIFINICKKFDNFTRFCAILKETRSEKIWSILNCTGYFTRLQNAAV